MDRLEQSKRAFQTGERERVVEYVVEEVGVMEGVQWCVEREVASSAAKKSI